MRNALVRAAYRTQQLSFLINAGIMQETARILTRQKRVPVDPDTGRTIRKRFLGLLNRDLRNVEEGLYPRDLLFGIPFRRYLRAFPTLIADAPSVVRRMRANNYKDLPDIDQERYPPYYRRTFHWQTDGYLSRQSAEKYQLGVELLFRGTADVMRRQIIPPVTRFLSGRNPADVKLLDIASGVGQPLDQLSVAHPQVRYFGVEMSPHYAQYARERLAHVAELTMVADNAEYLPFVDEYFDIVTSVYLFHELPRNARRRVVREAYRTLRPGGLLVLQDSAQPSESGELASALRGFSRDFHEPFFDDYLRDDLGALVEECGFELESVEPHLVAKVVTARKPLH